MPPMLRWVSRGKGQYLERQNRKDTRHGIENQAAQERQSQREGEGHIRSSRSLIGSAGIHICRRGWRDRAAGDIDLQILCLRRVA